MMPLRDYLLDAYAVPSEGRHQDPAWDRPIKVDDLGPGDASPPSCSITVSVPDRLAQGLILRLRNVPHCPKAVALVEGLGGTARSSRDGVELTLPLKSSQGPAIARLALAIGGLVGEGRRYDPNLKEICHRAAVSLGLLVEHLTLYREELWPDRGHASGPVMDLRNLKALEP